MSDLQIALIAIGALIIIAVLIINWWQERRFHRQVESSFSQLKRDALLEDPSLDASHLYDTLDKDTLEHFSVDDELSEIEIPEPTIKIEETDSLGKLHHNYDPNEIQRISELLQEEDAIDATFDRLVSPKLERQHASDTNVESSANINPHLGNSIPSNSFKEIFNEALNSDSNTKTENLVKDEKLAMLEPAVCLPDTLRRQVDLTALLYLAAETPLVTLNNMLTGLFNDFDKPVFVHVLDANKQWHLHEDNAPSPEALISKVACSIQLADRGGALSRNTLNRFHLAVETFGLDINGHVEWQGAGDTLTNANALDAFCLEVDKTIGFHLLHGENGAFTGTKLRGLAESQGLSLNSDGTFKYFDDTSLNKLQPQALFVMFNRDDHSFSPNMLRNSVVKGVTFQLDIPHVKQSIEAFNNMVQIARQMEIGLNAVLVDDNNKVLGDTQIEKIRQQLKVIQSSMLMRGILPGSDVAHRLFS